MSAQDPRPAPRRRKLVLRKIADGAARAPAEVAPSSGSISAVRSSARASQSFDEHVPQASLPKPRPSLMLPLESEPALTEPHSERVLAARQEPEQEPEEVEPEEAIALEEDPPPQASPQEWLSPAADDWRSSDVGDIAAMTPAIPREPAVPVWAPIATQPAAQPSMPRMNAPGVAPGPSREWVPRASVAPVVNTLPPAGAVLNPFRVRRRLSADSKLLAGGGALAAAMLLVALGVLLGQRSSAPGAPSAAASGPYPVVVDTRAAAPVALPAAPAVPPVEARPAPEPAAIPRSSLSPPPRSPCRSSSCGAASRSRLVGRPGGAQGGQPYGRLDRRRVTGRPLCLDCDAARGGRRWRYARGARASRQRCSGRAGGLGDCGDCSSAR